MPVSLEQLFAAKIFRIPDYQRGYAWQSDQYKNFWEDLVNLREGRSHYTGLLTLSEMQNVPNDSREHWLVEDHSYKVFNIIDGQQRLTTVIIFIQALAEFFKTIPENKNINIDQIYLTDTLSLAEIERLYLYKINPRNKFRTYKFGYTDDNPSQQYFRHQILRESGNGNIQETFYTLNLSNAKHYFLKQISAIYHKQGVTSLKVIFKKLTKRFLFNEYSLGDEFDVFVAFETMNNRGKKLSYLELLKNRLIYLTTLYGDEQLDIAGRTVLRENINLTWKEIYYQLGRNRTKPLNDDDFLRAHWITYFKYSRNTGRDYAQFLLDKYFIPQNVHELIEENVTLEQVEEQRSENEFEDQDDLTSIPNDPLPAQVLKLDHSAITDYVACLKESSGHWFNSFHPYLVTQNMSNTERNSLDRLNRIGIGYFRPLVMVILKKIENETDRISIFDKIERFIFLAFRLGTTRSNYRSSEFYNISRLLNFNEISLDEISEKLNINLSYTFNPDNTLRIDDFYNYLDKKFTAGGGYYDWSGLRYVLYEYELSLLAQTVQEKVKWTDLLKSDNDRISIEHIYPQTPTQDWEAQFKDLDSVKRKRYSGSIGNLLLLSMSINAALQNDSFLDKKSPKLIGDRKVRNGYADGSHSEIEVAHNAVWGPVEIENRGLKILKFMEKQWGFNFKNEDRKKLLFLS